MTASEGHGHGRGGAGSGGAATAGGDACGGAIEFWHRDEQRLLREEIYGERWLRWTYGSVAGRLALWLLVRRRWFSKWYGWRMSRPASRAKVRPFIDEYGLDEGEFAEPADSFPHFNAFFARRLKPEARPLAGDESTLVLPADGRHLLVPRLDTGRQFYAKGEPFDVESLLGDAELGRRFADGSMLISRLCPVDYHRFHFPCGGRLEQIRRVGGPLYSVNPLALRGRLDILWSNAREISLLHHPLAGLVVLAEIGATCVGSIRQSARPGQTVVRGQEKGWFEFGGSCCITLFQRETVLWDEDLVQWSARGIEVYGRMGERCGQLRAPAPADTAV